MRARPRDREAHAPARVSAAALRAWPLRRAGRGSYSRLPRGMPRDRREGASRRHRSPPARAPEESARNGSWFTSSPGPSRVPGRIASGSEICGERRRSGGERPNAGSRRHVGKVAWSRRETVGTTTDRNEARWSGKTPRPPEKETSRAPAGAGRGWPSAWDPLSALTTLVPTWCGSSRPSRSRDRRARKACSRACPPFDRMPRQVRAATPRPGQSGSAGTAPLFARFKYTPPDEAGQSATFLQFRSREAWALEILRAMFPRILMYTTRGC